MVSFCTGRHLEIKIKYDQKLLKISILFLFVLKVFVLKIVQILRRVMAKHVFQKFAKMYNRAKCESGKKFAQMYAYKSRAKAFAQTSKICYSAVRVNLNFSWPAV